MPKAEDPREGALKRLDERADALEARTTRNVPDYGGKTVGQGSRLVAGLLGGPFVGLAIGGGIDLLAHTRPWGMIVGIVIGFVTSVILAVQAAQRMSAAAAKDWGPPQDIGFDDEEDL